jgi:bifunctional non-homologous end joining protein LigD
METLSIGQHTVELTHTDRVLFPDDGITKGDLIAYYRAVAETLLPHLRDRPLTLHRFPGGLARGGFIQQAISDYYPDWIPRFTVEKEGGRLTHVVCNNIETLVYLANQACITLHTWLSRTDALHQPDKMILDLDPDNNDFEVVRFAARTLHGLMEEVGLPSFLMTTGSRGLHVTVPLDRSADFSMVREFAQDLAAELVRRAPERLTTEQRKESRQGRLFVDTFRNAYGQTAVAPYAVRARPGAPVATPLDWRELDDPELSASRYTLRNLPHRLAQQADPWQHIADHAVSLDIARKRLEALQESSRH